MTAALPPSPKLSSPTTPPNPTRPCTNGDYLVVNVNRPRRNLQDLRPRCSTPRRSSLHRPSRALDGTRQAELGPALRTHRRVWIRLDASDVSTPLIPAPAFTNIRLLPGCHHRAGSHSRHTSAQFLPHGATFDCASHAAQLTSSTNTSYGDWEYLYTYITHPVTMSTYSNTGIRQECTCGKEMSTE
jgi:hypothetical protein